MADFIDEREIRRALALLKKPGELFEVRIVCSNKKIMSGYFKDVDLMIKELKRADLRKANVYFTLNGIDDACYDRSQRDHLSLMTKATTSDNDIRSYDYIMVDIDPQRPSDTSSTDEQIRKARDLGNKVYTFLKMLGFETPAKGFSGNGVHLLYKVALVKCDDNKNLVKRALETLAMLFDTEDVKVDTTTFNPARVCKLYGTLAQKGTSSNLRPHRMSMLLGKDTELKSTDIEYIKKLNSYYPQELDKPQRYNNFNPRGFDMDEWLTKYNVPYKKISFSGGDKYVLDQCPFDENHKAPDSAIFKMHSGALGFKCFHNSCEGKNWHDVRMHFEPEAFESRRQYDEAMAYRSYNRDKPVPHIEVKDDSPVFYTAHDILTMPQLPKTFVKTGYTKFDDAAGGLVKGGTSLVSGCRGSAKSTWLSQVILNAVDSGNRVACFSGELNAQKFLSWMMKQAAGKGFISQGTMYENDYFVEKKYMERISQWLGDNFYLYNNKYGNNFTAMMEQFKKIVVEKKIDLLVLDNLMAFDIKNLGETKNDTQTEFALTLHRMAEEHNIHIIFVAHPRKAFGFLRLDDVSGSGDLSNAVDNAFIIHRVNKDFLIKTQQMFGWKEDNELYQATNVVEVCKERESGIQDFFVPLWYENETKRLKNNFTENIIYGWNKDDSGFFTAVEAGEVTPFDLDETGGEQLRLPLYGQKID